MRPTTAAPGGSPSFARKQPSAASIPTCGSTNFEYIAAEKIGYETVTYVANIFKYYVAYRLVEESLKEREEAIEKMKRN